VDRASVKEPDVAFWKPGGGRAINKGYTAPVENVACGVMNC
jgi:hypothetical protein